MLSKTETNQSLNDLKLAREEVRQLKAKLSKLNADKENWFKKRTAIGHEIKNKISEVRGSKEKRNSLTKEVRNAKFKRDELNKNISNSFKELQLLKDKFKHSVDKHQSRDRPEALKKQMDELEFKIETEAVSFEKEQKIMKDINNLKKRYNEVKGVTEEINIIKEKTREVNHIKKEANRIHKGIQSQARGSQEFHERLIENSKEIDLLKKKEEEIRNQFLIEKQKYTEVNDELKAKLQFLNQLKDTLKKNDVEIEELEQEKKNKTLKEKEQEVEKKIRKKLKITTEDILVMQRTEENRSSRK
ncbi:MAG: hypothetical protein ABIB43_00580 [archaeon]